MPVDTVAQPEDEKDPGEIDPGEKDPAEIDSDTVEPAADDAVPVVSAPGDDEGSVGEAAVVSAADGAVPVSASGNDDGALTRNGERRITRGDIESSLRRLRGEVDATVKSKARQLIPLLAGAGVLIVVIAYLMGRRIGATRSTVVEIRRI